MKAAVRADFFDRCAWAFEAFDRHERSAREEQVKQEAHELYAERFEGRLNEVDDALYYLNKEIMRTKILEKAFARMAAPDPDSSDLVRNRRPAARAWFRACSPAAKRRCSPSRRLRP